MPYSSYGPTYLLSGMQLNIRQLHHSVHLRSGCMQCKPVLEAAAILTCFCGVPVLGSALYLHRLLLDNCKAERWLYSCQQGCSEQITLEGQDLPRTYLAHHELESVIIMILIIIHEN